MKGVTSPPAGSACGLGTVKKVRDIVGLQLNPPDKAWVLSIDAMTQIQAQERTQSLLPVGLGYVGTPENACRRLDPNALNNERVGGSRARVYSHQ